MVKKFARSFPSIAAFGRVMSVCVDAMMVGSLETTVEEGEHVKHDQEFGYFGSGMF
jgi:phosphatidylserine decarboxylase